MRTEMNGKPEQLPLGAVKTADGDVVIAATRRPDGSMRKPVRIRQGHVPQEEVAAYKTPAQRVSLVSCVGKDGIWA